MENISCSLELSQNDVPHIMPVSFGSDEIIAYFYKAKSDIEWINSQLMLEMILALR